MKYVVSLGSFRQYCTSLEACLSVKECLVEKFNIKAKDVIIAPISDGGDGALEIINFYDKQSFFQKSDLTLNLNKNYRPQYLCKNDTVNIECSEYVGLKVVNAQLLNNFKSYLYSTKELGQELINLFRNPRCKNLNIFLGGSSTVDLGIGLAIELGVKFISQKNTEISWGEKGLLAFQELEKIDVSNLLSLPIDMKINLYCDVTSQIRTEGNGMQQYFTQKNIVGNEQKIISRIINKFLSVVKRDFNRDLSNTKFSGCNGGLAGMLSLLYGLKLSSGLQFFKSLYPLNLFTAKSTFITGEGYFDETTLHGKAPAIIVEGITSMSIKSIHYFICGGVSASILDLIPKNLKVLTPINVRSKYFMPGEIFYQNIKSF